jgi:tRNA dimethylallyltransferase
VKFEIDYKPDSLVILGATASGKTKLAVSLARYLDGEILSIDSRMVFKRMDIGTGKDLLEYIVDDTQVIHHLIDLVEPNEDFHIYKFQEAFKTAFKGIKERGKLPILAGGSGLYLEAVIRDYVYTSVPSNQALRNELITHNLSSLTDFFNKLPNHEYKKTADIATSKRAIRAIEILSYLLQNPSFILSEPRPIHPLILGLNPPIEIRRKRIIDRLIQRIEEGLIEEVENLLKSGIDRERIAFFGLEYKWCLRFIEGEISKFELIENLGIAIQQFAKRQMTYFRKMEKSGLKIHWLENINAVKDIEEALKITFAI